MLLCTQSRVAQPFAMVAMDDRGCWSCLSQGGKGMGSSGKGKARRSAGGDVGVSRGERVRLRSAGEARADADRHCVMTTDEASATNNKLPKGFKFVPVSQLRKSSRATAQQPP